ncbi:MAG: efflux RND transporter periplasmic adaptor subunit [Gemmatimonadota bacterium]
MSTASPPRDPSPARGPNSADPRAGARGVRLLVIGLVVVAGALLVTGVLPRLAKKRLLQAAASAGAAPPQVTVAQPKLGDESNALVLPGTLYGLHETGLYARANGYVKRVRVDMGSRVRAGDTLAVVETPEIDQELRQARATLAQVEASGQLARLTLARWRSLVEQKVATQQELDEKQAAFNVSEASADAARANVERLTTLTRFGSIIAPFSGVVTARNVDMGALVAPGVGTNTRPLFSLAQMDRMRVVTSVPQSIAASVREGQEAEILVQELGNAAFKGRVTRTSRSLDLTTRTLLTEIQLDNANGRLMPGMFAQVRLTLPRVSRTLLIPSNTLMTRAEGPQVAVVRDGRVRILPVTLGRDYGAQIEVLTGVTPDDRLVVNPGDDMVEGVAVRVGTTPKASPP